MAAPTHHMKVKELLNLWICLMEIVSRNGMEFRSIRWIGGTLCLSWWSSFCYGGIGSCPKLVWIFWGQHGHGNLSGKFMWKILHHWLDPSAENDWGINNCLWRRFCRSFMLDCDRHIVKKETTSAHDACMIRHLGFRVCTCKIQHQLLMSTITTCILSMNLLW
jgi:hypothetical protein